MFRHRPFATLVLLFAATSHQAAAQRGNDFFRKMDRDRARGYTDKELIDEKKLLLDKSHPITWEWLPLIEYPRVRPLPVSQSSPADPVVAKFSELPPSKIEADRKKFVDTKLKDRTFSGTVRIARNEPTGDKFTIYANEPSRPFPGHVAVPGLGMMWPPYFCQWQSDTDRGFHVGQNVDIVGKIEDLKEDGTSHTLFLKDVSIATPAAKKNAP